MRMDGSVRSKAGLQLCGCATIPTTTIRENYRIRVLRSRCLKMVQLGANNGKLGQADWNLAEMRMAMFQRLPLCSFHVLVRRICNNVLVTSAPSSMVACTTLKSRPLRLSSHILSR